MKFVEAVYILILNLPKLIEMYRKQKEDERVKDDLKNIDEAFRDRDSERLRSIFNS